MITSENPKVRQGMDLVDSMESEELDQLVDYIRYVFRAKRNANNGRAYATIQVGDRVKLTGSFKPQYIRGLTGEVIEKKQTRVTVLLDGGPVGKFKSGKVVATPSGLTVIDR